MLCAFVIPANANIGGSGPAAAVSNQPLLGVVDAPSCTSGQYLLLTSSEFEAQVSSLNPLTHLSVTDGASIAGAILAIWAIGWAFRVLIRTLSVSDGELTEKESS